MPSALTLIMKHVHYATVILLCNNSVLNDSPVLMFANIVLLVQSYLENSLGGRVVKATPRT